jgi:glycerol-3-phosphate dehydrogenase
VLPHHRGLRPALLIRLGLLLYDHLGVRRSLPASASVDLRRAPEGKPLKPGLTRGFEYSDCWVDDARLVVLNAMDAAARGATIRVRTEVVSARRSGGCWQVELCDVRSGRRETVEARALVNAGGAFVASVIAGRVAAHAAPRVRLVKGSHIVVPSLFDHAKAYIFQNEDRRIVFAIPYERDFTLIGTTDVDFSGDASRVSITDAETEYLCAAANGYFARPIAPSDVVWSYAGVRALHDDGHASAQDTSRDFVLELDGRDGEAPLLSVIGGKLTTYRHVAEEALKRLAPEFPRMGPAWTRGAVLPGGDLGGKSRDELARDLAAGCPPLDPAVAQRLARSYGTMARAMLAGVARREDLGIDFGAGLSEREVRHLVDREWAGTADDVLWRRTKLGLRMTETERGRLAGWLEGVRPSGPAQAQAGSGREGAGERQ